MVDPLLSVIIPTLNEEVALPALLSDLAAQQAVALEVRIGDGGSSDGTEAVARAQGTVFISAPRGRGAQMNAAARGARAPYLLFLHADSRVADPCLLARALTAFHRHRTASISEMAGHFRLHFARSGPGHELLFRFLEAKTAFNREYTINGDQGLLLTRTFFDQLGGFDESLPFLEDQRLSAAVRCQGGHWCTLPGTLATSARRFESEGCRRRYLLMGIMMGMYVAGEERFFARAPAVYRVQTETGRLRLAPIFRLLWSLARRDWGPVGTARIFFRLGRLLCVNGWQLALLLAVWRGPLSQPEASRLVHGYDRLIAPLLASRPAAMVAGLGCFFWYMGALSAWFILTEELEHWLGSRQHGSA